MTIDHSGGVVVSFTLLNADGSVEMAETLYDYEGYAKGEKVASQGLGSNIDTPSSCD